MAVVPVPQIADRIAALMQDRLGIGGRGLSAKLRRGGRFLPRPIRADARTVAEAAAMAENPKLARRIDEAGVSRAYQRCVVHLEGIAPDQRKRGLALSMVSSVMVSLLVVGLLALTVLKLRGFL
jgi:hypothetical protein